MPIWISPSPALPVLSFFNQGQVCCAGSRLFVQEKRSTTRWSKASPVIAREIKIGPGTRPEHRDGAAGVADPVRPRLRLPQVRSRRRCACAWSAASSGDKGYFVQPTVLVDTHREDERLSGRDFRPGGHRDAVQGSRRRSDPPRQRHGVRPGFGHLQHQSGSYGPSPGGAHACRYLYGSTATTSSTRRCRSRAGSSPWGRESRSGSAEELPWKPRRSASACSSCSACCKGRMLRSQPSPAPQHAGSRNACTGRCGASASRCLSRKPAFATKIQCVPD